MINHHVPYTDALADKLLGMFDEEAASYLHTINKLNKALSENKGEDRPKGLTLSEVETYANEHNYVLWTEEMSEKALALIKADRGRPKGEWKRMSDLPEDKDDRYECSRCGNVVHYKKRMDLYTFNSWCGRCGSNNDPNRYDER